MKTLIILLLTSTIASAEPCIVTAGLPDKSCTPGAIRPETTLQDICTPNFTKSIRNVPEKLKKQVYAQYHMNQKQKPCPCEVDHFISLVLGGSNELTNLWPQTYQEPYGARQKDKLENYYHRQICAGKITQEEAIRELREDWIKYFKLYKLDKKGNSGAMEENEE